MHKLDHVEKIIKSDFPNGKKFKEAIGLTKI